MCFPKPKPPPVPVEDPILKDQVRAAKDDERSRRTSDKQARFEEVLQQFGSGFGRRSLLSGGRGGAGFAMPSRSLLSATVAG